MLLESEASITARIYSVLPSCHLLRIARRGTGDLFYPTSAVEKKDENWLKATGGR